MKQGEKSQHARVKQKPLWRCPLCGHRFVTRNLWHSCGTFRLSDHFARSQPEVRKLYRSLVKLIRSFGPVEIYPQKTRIVFLVRVRFVGVAVRKSYLLMAFWLTRRIEDPRILRVQSLYPLVHIHEVRIDSSKDIDATLRRWLREAYAVGRQEHLDQRRLANKRGSKAVSLGGQR